MQLRDLAQKIAHCLFGPLSHPRIPRALSFFGLNLILTSNESNLGSERSESNLGWTLAQASQLERSWKALSSHLNASSLSPSPTWSIAIQYEGTYWCFDRSTSFSRIFLASCL